MIFSLTNAVCWSIVGHLFGDDNIVLFEQLYNLVASWLLQPGTWKLFDPVHQLHLLKTKKLDVHKYNVHWKAIQGNKYLESYLNVLVCSASSCQIFIKLIGKQHKTTCCDFWRAKLLHFQEHSAKIQISLWTQGYNLKKVRKVYLLIILQSMSINKLVPSRTTWQNIAPTLIKNKLCIAGGRSSDDSRIFADLVSSHSGILTSRK